MNYGVCHLSTIPLRAQPSDQSEMTHQLLYGESYQILEEQAKWSKIQLDADHYTAWIDNKQVNPLSKDEYAAYQEEDFSISTTLLEKAKGGGQTLWIPFGSTLPQYKDGKFIFLGNSYNFNGTVTSPSTSSVAQLEFWAQQFLNVPYLWGGRSPFGIDCSGFTQVIFKALGIPLPRDTSEQKETGEKVPFDEARTGDLVFCKKQPDGDINHVGIVLDNRQIVHASGHVRIDRLDKKGIVNPKTDEYSHSFAFLKRYL